MASIFSKLKSLCFGPREDCKIDITTFGQDITEKDEIKESLDGVPADIKGIKSLGTRILHIKILAAFIPRTFKFALRRLEKAKLCKIS